MLANALLMLEMDKVTDNIENDVMMKLMLSTLNSMLHVKNLRMISLKRDTLDLLQNQPLLTVLKISVENTWQLSGMQKKSKTAKNLVPGKNDPRVFWMI